MVIYAVALVTKPYLTQQRHLWENTLPKHKVDLSLSFASDCVDAIAAGSTLEDKDFVVPVNYAAANIDAGEAVSADCCKTYTGKPDSSELSTDSTRLVCHISSFF